MGSSGNHMVDDEVMDSFGRLNDNQMSAIEKIEEAIDELRDGLRDLEKAGGDFYDVFGEECLALLNAYEEIDNALLTLESEVRR